MHSLMLFPEEKILEVLQSHSKDSLKEISAVDKLRGVAAAIKIMQEAYGVYCYFKPSDAQLLQYKKMNQQLKILKTEQALYDCLIQQAKNPQLAGFPIECNERADLFATYAGFESLNNVKKEFAQALSRRSFIDKVPQPAEPKKGMSTTKKIIIGGVIVVGVTGAAIVVAPLVLPTGSVLAVKAAAITAGAKSTAAVAAAKTGVVLSSAKTAIVAGASKAAAVITAMDSLEKFNAIPLVIDGGKLMGTLIELSLQDICPSREQELRQLLQKRAHRKTLVELIGN